MSDHDVITEPCICSVVRWCKEQQREVGIAQDGSVVRLVDAPLMPETTAKDVAKKFGGTVIWFDEGFYEIEGDPR